MTALLDTCHRLPVLVLFLGRVPSIHVSGAFAVIPVAVWQLLSWVFRFQRFCIPRHLSCLPAFACRVLSSAVWGIWYSPLKFTLKCHGVCKPFPGPQLWGSSLHLSLEPSRHLLTFWCHEGLGTRVVLLRPGIGCLVAACWVKWSTVADLSVL